MKKSGVRLNNRHRKLTIPAYDITDNLPINSMHRLSKAHADYSTHMRFLFYRPQLKQIPPLAHPRVTVPYAERLWQS